MKLKIYIIFPDKDDDFIRIGHEPESYQEMVKRVSIMRDILKKNVEHEFWFDNTNLLEFAKKANSIVGGHYISNISQQLRIYFGTTAKNINDNKISLIDCTYVRLNSDFTIEHINLLLSEAAESSIIDNVIQTVVFNINESFRCDRETVNIIKDASHLSDLPELVRLQVFNNEYELKEWLNSKVSDSKFTLRDKTRFTTTGKVWVKQSIYVDKKSGNYWYFDYFHKDNKIHFEVYDHTGNHLFEADENGIEKPNSKSDKKKISDII